MKTSMIGMTAGALLLGSALALWAMGEKPAPEKEGCAGGVCMVKPAAPAPHAETHAYGEIDTRALAALIQARTPMVLLDARAGKYDDGRRIPGAKALAPGATAEQAAQVIPTKETLVVAYCTNLKCPASRLLAEQLAKLGYTNLLKYPEGIEGWAAAGMKVEPPAK